MPYAHVILLALQEVGEIVSIAYSACAHLRKMTYYYAPSYAVTPNQGYYVVQNSGTSSDTSWSDELKKAGSNFVEWLRSSKLPKGWSKGTPRCFSCHKTGATIKFSGDVAFCSQKCHHDALQKYQKELGKACNFYLTVKEGGFYNATYVYY